MTLILALVCREGVILASDSQITVETTGQPVKATGQKIFAPWSNVMWGASTNRVGLVQHVRDHLATTFQQRTRFENRTRQQIRNDIATEVSRKYKEALGRAIQIPGIEAPKTSFLFAGLARDGPFIVEIHPDLTDTDHTEPIGHAAIGSGEIFPYHALASLQHFNLREATLYQAKLLAYRVMQDAINVAAYGLGPPIQMIEMALPSAGSPNAEILDIDELRRLGDKVTEWKELEIEVLGRFVGISPEPGPTVETTTPTPSEPPATPPAPGHESSG